MRPVPPPIGIAETARGILVTLPQQFALVVSLRRTFRGTEAAEAPWTYRVPAGARVERTLCRLEAWIAEVELQARAEARRRSWCADDAEWSGATAAVTAPGSPPAALAIVTLPRKRTAHAALQLLAEMAAGAVLVVVIQDGARSYRLAPSGRTIRTAIAERVIRARLVAPGGDGLFGPDFSQTWRHPSPEEVDAAVQRSRARSPRAPRPGPPRPAGPAARPGLRRPRGSGAAGLAPLVAADALRRAAAGEAVT